MNWNKDDLRGYNEPYPLIFHFKDPERLPPEASPYYYFASRAQHYLCREAKLPEPMERYVIEVAHLKVARLADYEILPQLPRPACYDETPAAVAAKQGKSKRKIRASTPLFDEVYSATDPDYPFPPLRYAAKSEDASNETLGAILTIFIEQGFMKTVPKIKQGDAAPYLSLVWRESPPRKGTVKAWMCSFKPHLNLSMSDELSLKITLLASKSPLPIFKGAFVPFEKGGGVTAREQTCNIVLYIDQPNREEIGADSSLMRNLHKLLQDIKSRLGIVLRESPPPEYLVEVTQ